MHGITLHLDNIGVGRSYYPSPLLDATSPVPPPTALVVFIIILIVLRGGGVGRSAKPIPQLSHEFSKILPPVGGSRYKTGKLKTLGNHCRGETASGRRRKARAPQIARAEEGGGHPMTHSTDHAWHHTPP